MQTQGFASTPTRYSGNRREVHDLRGGGVHREVSNGKISEESDEVGTGQGM